MRLLIVGLNFAPELTGIGKYTGELAAWLARRGHDVSVVTTRPYYPEWNRPGWAGWTWGRETWEGCRVVRCPLFVPRRQTGLMRILHLASFGLSCIPAVLARVLRGRADVVMVMAPTQFSAPAAWLGARLMRAKAWLHILDLELDAAVELGFVRNRSVVALGRRLERWLIWRFDRVSTISSRMLEAIERKGLPRERLVLFPNWVDTDAFKPLPRPVPLRHELGIPEDRCVVLYSGSMGRKQGLEHVIAAARLFADDGERSPLFLLAGAGPVRAELEAAARDLANVRFLPLQPAGRFNEFLNVADIHLLPQRREASDLVMPSKLLAMLATGRPVIAMAPRDSELDRVLVGVGVVTPPEEPLPLAAAVRNLAADAARRQNMGRAAAQLAHDTMCSEAILSELEQRLSALSGAAEPLNLRAEGHFS